MPGREALPRTRPAAGLVQPRALRPALSSPLSSDRNRRWRHSDPWAAARREEARVPEGPPHLTGSVNRGARPRPGAPREIQERFQRGVTTVGSTGRQKGGVRAQQGAGTKAWRRSGHAGSARARGHQPAAAGRRETRPAPLYTGISAMLQMNPSVRRKQNPGLQNSRGVPRRRGGEAWRARLGLEDTNCHTPDGQCAAQRTVVNILG